MGWSTPCWVSAGGDELFVSTPVRRFGSFGMSSFAASANFGWAAGGGMTSCTASAGFDRSSGFSESFFGFAGSVACAR